MNTPHLILPVDENISRISRIRIGKGGLEYRRVVGKPSEWWGEQEGNDHLRHIMESNVLIITAVFWLVKKLKISVRNVVRHEGVRRQQTHIQTKFAGLTSGV